MRDGCGPERAHRRVSDPRLPDPDPESGVVGRLEQRAGDPERLAQRPGQDTNPGQPQRPQPLQHLADHRTAKDTLLQRVAVNQQWRVERLEGADSDGVPGPAADDAEIGFTRPDVLDQPALGVDLTGPPAVFDVDLHGPAGEPPHLVGEPVEFPGLAIEVGQRQHDRLARLTPAGLVQAGTRAAGEHRHHCQQHDRPRASRHCPLPPPGQVASVRMLCRHSAGAHQG